jgi:hypothetical protein
VIFRRKPKEQTPDPPSEGQPTRPPFPLGRVRRPWMEQSLARIAEQRFITDVLSKHDESGNRFTDEAIQTMEDHWHAAASSARPHLWRGGAVERVVSHLDAVDNEILRLAPTEYVNGQLPGVLAEIKQQLPARDSRVQDIARLVRNPPEELQPSERDLIVATQRAASAEARRQVRRLSSFTRVLFATAWGLTLGAILIAAVGVLAPRALPVCFNPVGGVVCPTSMTDPPTDTTASATGATTSPPGTTTPPDATPPPAGTSSQEAQGQPKPVTADVDVAMRENTNRWDIALIEVVGLLAAAVAAAGSLSRIRGTSTPFMLPLALAVLKLPTGALTAILGLLLMRGGFVPGLGALDTPAQIIAWAIVLGYSQQLLTQFVDRQAQSELNNFGRSEAVRKQDEFVAGVGLNRLDDAGTPSGA